VTTFYEPLCNLCGLTLCLGSAGYRAPHGLVNAKVVGGYSSTPGNGEGALDDLDGYKFSLCEFCLDWLFGKFAVPVETYAPMNEFLMEVGETVEEALKKRGMVKLSPSDEPGPWRPAAQRVQEEEWRKDKEQFFAEKARRDKARRVK